MRPQQNTYTNQKGKVTIERVTHLFEDGLNAQVAWNEGKMNFGNSHGEFSTSSNVEKDDGWGSIVMLVHNKTERSLSLIEKTSCWHAA